MRRFASLALPLDEALVEVALDLSGRPYLAYAVDFAAGHARARLATLRAPARRGILAGLRHLGAPSPFMSACERARTPITWSKPPSRASLGRYATRSGWKGRASLRPRAPCDGTARAIAVLDYGIGNLRSAEKALQHLGADAGARSRPDDVAGAAGVVLPGVGDFGRCADALRTGGLDAAPPERRSSAGTPFLGICVGFQLLYERLGREPRALEGLGRASPARSADCRPG